MGFTPLVWSQWRRAHQAVAQHCHTRRRARQASGAYLSPEIRIIDLPETVALTTAHWEAILPLLPPQRTSTGRPPHDHRRILEGILWVARHGAPWRELPTDFGARETIHSRYTRWRKEGLWPRLMAVVHPIPTTITYGEHEVSL
jgi:hypothetical protein